jgi:hypothetical protein
LQGAGTIIGNPDLQMDCMSSDNECLLFLNNTACGALPDRISGITCRYIFDNCPVPCTGFNQQTVCVNCALVEKMYIIIGDAIDILIDFFTSDKYQKSLQRFLDSWASLFNPDSRKRGFDHHHGFDRTRAAMQRMNAKRRVPQKPVTRGFFTGHYEGMKRTMEYVSDSRDAFDRFLREVNVSSDGLLPAPIEDVPIPPVPSLMDALDGAAQPEGTSLTWDLLIFFEPLFTFFGSTPDEFFMLFQGVLNFFTSTDTSDPNTLAHYLALLYPCQHQAVICCTAGMGLKATLLLALVLVALFVFYVISVDERISVFFEPFMTLIILGIFFLPYGWTPLCGFTAIPYCLFDDVTQIWNETFTEEINWPPCFYEVPPGERQCGVFQQFKDDPCGAAGINDAVDVFLYVCRYTTVWLDIPDPLQRFKTPYDENDDTVLFVRSIPYFGDKLDKFVFTSLDDIPCGYTTCAYLSPLEILGTAGLTFLTALVASPFIVFGAAILGILLFVFYGFWNAQSTIMNDISSMTALSRPTT